MSGKTRSLYSYLKENAVLRGKSAATVSDRCTLSWVQTYNAVRSLAAKFSKLGMRRGKNVALRAVRSADLVIIVPALMACEVLIVIADPFIHNKNNMPKVDDSMKIDFFLTDEERQGAWESVYGKSSSSTRFDPAALEEYPEMPEPSLTCDSMKPAFMFFTSGSTAEQKMVVLSESSMVCNAYRQARIGGVNDSDLYTVAMPMHHIFGIAVLLAGITTGAGMCFTASINPTSILIAIEKHKCTILDGVPTLFFAIIEEQERQQRDISSLLHGVVAGGSYSKEQFAYIEKRLGLRLCPSYGMTETSTGAIAVGLDEDFDARSGSAGRFISGVSGVLKTMSGEVILQPDTVGEICLKSDCLMLGYYAGGNLELPLDDDGYFHTGDLAYADEQGNYHIAGRCKDIIIRGGENISSVHIENAITALDGVINACVVGVPDEKYGEVVGAYVVSSVLSEKPLKESLGAVLSKMEIPSVLIISESIPTLSSGKPDKLLIAKLLEGEKNER